MILLDNDIFIRAQTVALHSIKSISRIYLSTNKNPAAEQLAQIK